MLIFYLHKPLVCLWVSTTPTTQKRAPRRLSWGLYKKISFGLSHLPQDAQSECKLLLMLSQAIAHHRPNKSHDCESWKRFFLTQHSNNIVLELFSRCLSLYVQFNMLRNLFVDLLQNHLCLRPRLKIKETLVDTGWTRDKTWHRQIAEKCTSIRISINRSRLHITLTIKHLKNTSHPIFPSTLLNVMVAKICLFTLLCVGVTLGKCSYMLH